MRHTSYRQLWLVLRGEIAKQHHHHYHSCFVFFSLLVWPVFGFFTVYFSYKPFSLAKGTLCGIAGSQDLMIFLCAGYMAYNCFWAIVQSAWNMTWLERQSGTLEIAFLSPANRLAMMYGKALGALFEETWMFLCFCLFMLFWAHGFSLRLLILLPLVFFVLLISASIWGGLLNTVFLLSRDASMIYSMFEDTMVLLAGVRVPVGSFPPWAKAISLVFPLTYCINIIRALFMVSVSVNVWQNLGQLFVCLLFMIVATVLLLKRAEAVHRDRGELGLY